MARLAPFFFVSYLAGVFGLIWFDLHVLDLGDPKLRTAVDIYFPVWSASYSPAVITALVFQWRSLLRGRRLWWLAVLHLTLIFVALEVSFVLDTRWPVLLLEFLILGLLFWKIQKVSEKIRYA
jgi:hypothetical protein